MLHLKQTNIKTGWSELMFISPFYIENTLKHIKDAGMEYISLVNLEVGYCILVWTFHIPVERIKEFNRS